MKRLCLAVSMALLTTSAGLLLAYGLWNHIRQIASVSLRLKVDITNENESNATLCILDTAGRRALFFDVEAGTTQSHVIWNGENSIELDRTEFVTCWYTSEGVVSMEKTSGGALYQRPVLLLRTEAPKPLP